MAPRDAVSEAALRDLVSTAARCVSSPLSPDPLEFLDWDVCRAQAHAFKLDVSFALRSDGAAGARFSLNDKGEPEAFRRRVLAAADRLQVSRRLVEALFALSRPGEVQTTLGIKWSPRGGAPERVSLYLEELMRTSRALQLMEDVARLAAATVRPVDGAVPAAACIDVSGDEVVAFKDYWMALERGDEAAVTLPTAAEAHRRRFPLDPHRGTRRYLFARRQQGAQPAGHKLLWMSEAHEPAAAARAWRWVDSIVESMALPPSLPGDALASLRRDWHHPEAYLYPDLVSLDADSAGTPQALVLYVSLKPSR